MDKEPMDKKIKILIIACISLAAVVLILGIVFGMKSCQKKADSTPAKSTSVETEASDSRIKGEEMIFDGQVIDIQEKTVTVSSGSLTAFFMTDEDTKKDKNLSKGDYVDVVYEGDLFEEPYATEIKVTDDRKEPKTGMAYGYVSEKSDKDITLAVASSKSYVFETDKDTRITGKSKELAIGDEVIVTYSGELEKKPKALNIEITKVSDKNIFKKINVTVKSIDVNKFTAEDRGNTYTFKTTNSTKYTGEKFKSGCKATVRYTGDLKINPEVDSVYVLKETPVKPTTKPTVKPESASVSKATEKKKETQFSQAQTEQPEEDEEPLYTIIGTIISITDDTLKIDTEEDTISFDIIDDTDIAAGYFPRPEDKVKCIYNEYKELIELLLIDRPDIYMDGTVKAYSKNKSITVELNDDSTDKFRELFPDQQLDDSNVFTASIDKDLVSVNSYDPKNGDMIDISLKEKDGQLYLVYVSYETSDD